MAQTITKSDGQTTVYRIEDVMPAANANYFIALDPGSYRIAVSIRSNVTGATSGFTIAAPVDEGGQVVALNYQAAPSDSGTATATPLVPAGSAGRLWTILPLSLNDSLLLLSYGLRLTIVKGGATTGEPFKVDVIATRADKVSIIPIKAQ